MKSWDAIIIGGGIIGLSLAISLRKQGLRVLVVERGEPGREASSAAAGMLAGSGLEIPPPLRALAEESARLYPEFVYELEDESGMKVDLREQGTILISPDGNFPKRAEPLSVAQLSTREPALQPKWGEGRLSVAYLSERSVDPPALVAAAFKAARHRDVDISSGSTVEQVTIENNRCVGVTTDKSSYSAAVVINCAGAWAGKIPPLTMPVRPVKGHMLSVIEGPELDHVIRSEDVYLVPRSDGRIVIGSTLEDAGFDKQVLPETIEKLFQSAAELLPALADARRHEAWAGLRPATPDDLPILGETSLPGYYIASGHYRDGILLAPVTAQVMPEVVTQKPCSLDLSAFTPARFEDEIGSLTQ